MSEIQNTLVEEKCLNKKQQVILRVSLMMKIEIFRKTACGG